MRSLRGKTSSYNRRPTFLFSAAKRDVVRYDEHDQYVTTLVHIFPTLSQYNASDWPSTMLYLPSEYVI